MIPLHTMTSRVVREALWCFENGLSWTEARERILTYYGHNSPCHAPQNLGFTVLGWLYGKDFGDKLCIAVNCGYDTDCTAATLGATLGILKGTTVIPQKWRLPVGEEIVLHLFTKKGHMENVPKTISELTKRTFNIAKRVLQEKSEIAIFKEKTLLPENALSLLFRNEKALKALQLDTQAGVSMAGDVEVTLHYSGEPVIRPNIDKMVGISLKLKDREIDADVILEVPEGWEVKTIKKGLDQKFFLLHASEIQDSNLIGVCVSLPDKQQCRTKFVILGQNASRGYPSGVNIARPSFKGSEEDWFRKIGLSEKSKIEH